MENHPLFGLLSAAYLQCEWSRLSGQRSNDTNRTMDILKTGIKNLPEASLILHGFIDSA
jgi:hypothetical protein